MFKYNEKQCVLEFQCSPISSEYYERHELYQAAGIEDIWILGTDKYLEKEENEKSKKFRTKEIEYNTSFYYDSEFKILNFKIQHDFDFDTILKLSNFNYSSIEKRRNFVSLIMKNTIFNSSFSTKLNNMTFNDHGIYFGTDIYNYLNNIQENINNTKNILNGAVKYLNKKYNLEFYHDKYSKYEIKYDKLSFEINYDNKYYRFCTFRFERDYSNYYITKKYKWKYCEDNELIKQVDNINYNTFISFVIKILKQYKII